MYSLSFSYDTPVTTLILKNEPILERTVFGLYKSTHPSDNNTPSNPAASAVLIIVPRLPGSFIQSQYIYDFSVLGVKSLSSSIFTTASMPCGAFVSHIFINTSSCTLYNEISFGYLKFSFSKKLSDTYSAVISLSEFNASDTDFIPSIVYSPYFCLDFFCDSDFTYLHLLFDEEVISNINHFLIYSI